MSCFRLCAGVVCIVLGFTAAAAAQDKALAKIAVNAGAHDRSDTPVRVLVPAAGLKPGAVVALSSGQGKALVGQLAAPGLMDQSAAKPDMLVLHFIVPSLKKGERREFTVTGTSQPPAAGFAWKDTAGKYADLVYDGRPMIRYMYETLDPARRDQTYKMYHHVYDLAGQEFLTKGPGSKFTHHRGIFYGFNKITYDGGKADTWHCGGDAHLSHEGFLAQEAGPVLGRHAVAVDWHGVGKKVFAKERRELGAYHVPGGYLIEFASRLVATDGKVQLAGDPQHAGFQFRANAEVGEKTSKETYYLRPDGKGKLGETRNWGKPGDKHANLPWDALSFVTGGKRYTCVYIDRPQNPKEARFSERDYGRFGSYFEYTLEPQNDLLINYRLWIQEGEMTVEQAAALSAAFIEPVEVTVQ